MAFLNPLVLAALAAAAIPLVIHLFNFRRARRIDYSSLRFLKELQRTRLQRVRVERWLLLLFRTLAVLCLIAVFARPILTGGAFTGDARVSMAVVIDNSLSMTLRDVAGTYLAQAQTYARTLAASADELFTLTTAPGTAAYGPAALQAIDTVIPDPRAKAALASISHAASVLHREGTHLNKEVYFLSDLQRSTLTDTADLALPGDVRVSLVPVGDSSPDNVAIEAVSVRSRIVEIGEPVRVEATLASYQTSRIDGYVASLYLEGERLAQESVDLAPGERRVIPFLVTPSKRGWLAGAVRAEDDVFAGDNQRFFTLHVPERRRILVVRGPLAETEYLTMALAPSGEAMHLETIGSAELARTDLRSYDAVLLVAPHTLSSGEVAALERYVSDGGGLMLFVGEEARDINLLLSVLQAGQISEIVATGRARVPIASVTGLDTEHPLFAGVFGDTKRMEQPAVYRAAVYEPRSGSEHTLLQLSNGRPFLQEVRKGNGLALICVVRPDPSWSDLPVRGLFVPMLHRAVHYLAASESVQGNRLTAGQPQSIRLGNTGGRIRLVTPDGEEITPEQRQVVGATVMDFPASQGTPGAYDVLEGGKVIRRMALNLNPKESDLSTETGAAAAAALSAVSGVRVQVVQPGSPHDLSQQARRDRVGVELWRLFVLLTLVFMGLEMLVSTRGKGRTA